MISRANARATQEGKEKDIYTRHRVRNGYDGCVLRRRCNAYSAIVGRLAKKLELHSVKDLEVETVVVGYLVRERKGHQEESTQKIIGLLNQYKRITCMEETGVVIDDDPAMPNKMFGRSTSLNIPHEFLCPITLEIMTDPVIVAIEHVIVT